MSEFRDIAVREVELASVKSAENVARPDGSIRFYVEFSADPLEKAYWAQAFERIAARHGIDAETFTLDTQGVLIACMPDQALPLYRQLLEIVVETNSAFHTELQREQTLRQETQQRVEKRKAELNQLSETFRDFNEK